jgi:hypothetical protein
MQVRVVVPVNLPATQTFIATVNRRPVPPLADRLRAIQRLRQRPGQPLQFIQLVAGEKIGVPEPSAFQ